MTKKQRTGTLYKRGNVYWLKYTLGGKRVQQSLGVTTEVEAEKERNRVMAPFRRADERDALAVMVKRLDVATTKHAQAEDETNPPLLLKNAFDEYRNATNRPDAGDATLDQYEVQFGLFNEWIAKTYPGATTMRQVSRAIADEFAAHLKASGRSSNTFNKYVRLLDLVFRVLKDKARLTENPWESIQRKRVVQRGRRELTIEELRTVCQSAEGELRLLLALGLYTGLRLGDCATLRWGEVDMKRSEIRRIPNKIARRKPHEVRIPIHPVLSAMLAEIIPSERGEFVLPDMAAKYERHQTYVTDIVQAHFDTCKIRTIKQGTGIEMSKDAEG
jgi:integrase